MNRTLSGVVEISTAALTVTNQPPVFVGEVGALNASISFMNNGVSADISDYTAEMYLFWPERREMSEAVQMGVSGNTASGSFDDEMTALPGAPLFIIQLTDNSGQLLVACAQPIQITQIRGDVVVTTRPPTPSEVVYVGRAPYIGANGNWMEWSIAESAYIDTGTPSRGEPGEAPDFAIGTVQTLPAGSSATASITGTAENPLLNLGIPKGDQGTPGATGATPNLTIGTVQTLSEDASATATITGTATNPVLNLGLPRGRTGSAENVYATNIPMSSIDSTTVAEAIAAAGNVETVAGVGVASGTKNIPLTGADVPLSSSDSTKISTKISTVEGNVSTNTSNISTLSTTKGNKSIWVDMGTVSSLPVTKTVTGVTTDMICSHAELGTRSAQLGNWTVSTDTAGQVTVSGSISGSTTLKLLLVPGNSVSGS